MQYPTGLRISFHVQAVVNLGSVVSGITGLVFYIRHQRHAQIYSTLIFHIITTIMFGVVVGDNYFRQVLSVYGIHFAIPLSYSWRVVLLIFPAYFVYVSGAILALDRVLALTFPFKHVYYKVSRNLTLLGVSVCVVNTLLMYTSNAIESGSVGEEDRWDHNTTTHMIYEVTYDFFEVVFLMEVIFHIVFCVQFYRYIRKKDLTVVRRHAQKTNHITLFQVTTQSLLCLLPKILLYTDDFILSERVEWIHDYHKYYSCFLTLNVFSVSCFVVYRFRPKKKVAVHAIPTARWAKTAISLPIDE